MYVLYYAPYSSKMFAAHKYAMVFLLLTVPSVFNMIVDDGILPLLGHEKVQMDPDPARTSDLHDHDTPLGLTDHPGLGKQQCRLSVPLYHALCQYDSFTSAKDAIRLPVRRLFVCMSVINFT